MTEQGKRMELTSENVKRFWDETAKKYKLNPHSTIRDHYFRLLEINAIRKLIKNKKMVLDIGCGNGYSTVFYSQDVGHIFGVDYSEEFIKWSKQLLKNFLEKYVAISDNIEFQVGDITNIDFVDEKFDAIVCERVLINLPSKDLQKKAVNELSRVLKRDGLLICVEVTEQGHESINRFRNMFGLGNIERYWHNLYLNESEFIKYLKKDFDICEIKRFGMYHFISKVIHPLMVYPKEPKFEAKINEVAMRICEKMPEFDDCGHQVMFVLKKK